MNGHAMQQNVMFYFSYFCYGAEVLLCWIDHSSRRFETNWTTLAQTDNFAGLTVSLRSERMSETVRGPCSCPLGPLVDYPRLLSYGPYRLWEEAVD